MENAGKNAAKNKNCTVTLQFIGQQPEHSAGRSTQDRCNPADDSDFSRRESNAAHVDCNEREQNANSYKQQTHTHDCNETIALLIYLTICVSFQTCSDLIH